MPITLVVEDGTGLANANAYLSLADADAYHAANVNADEWDGEDAEDKKKALIVATRTIDANMRWHGFRTTSAQALDWPRQRAANPDAYVYTAGLSSSLSGYFYNANAIPLDLKNATAQMALELIKNSTRLADAGEKGIRSINLGSGALQLDFDKTDRLTSITDEVSAMLKKLGSYTGGVGGFVRVTRR